MYQFFKVLLFVDLIKSGKGNLREASKWIKYTMDHFVDGDSNVNDGDYNLY